MAPVENKKKRNKVRQTVSGVSVVKFNKELVLEELRKIQEPHKPCSFCKEFCGNDWCCAKDKDA